MDNISFDNSFWTFLHVITFLFPDNPNIDNKKNYYIFFKNLKHLIPCKTCKAHYINHYNENNNLNNELIQSDGVFVTNIAPTPEAPTPEEPEAPEPPSPPSSASASASAPSPAPAPASESAVIYIHSNEMLNDDYINSLDYLQSKVKLASWFIDYHNTVNKLLNKPEYTYDEAKEYYEKMMENSEMLKKSTI